MKDTVLNIHNLSKQYGRIRAVDELNFTVDRGSVFGILAPNGSGKTTTLGIITDIIRPKSGTYQWFGQPPAKESRKKIGAIIEEPLFYPYLSGLNNLKLIAEIKGIPHRDINRVLKIVDLFNRRKDRFKTYSLGMKQRLAIAAALLGQPEVLILDEPTNGLDPQGIAEIRNLIKEIASDGITIIMASHLLDEVQKICSHVVVLRNGRSLFLGKVDEVHESETIIELASENHAQLQEILQKHPKVIRIRKEADKIIAQVEKGTTTAEINQFLIKQNVVLSYLNMQKKSLEKQFLELLAEK